MTTRQRLRLLAPLLKRFPALGGNGLPDLEKWVALELGSVDALDRWQKYGTARKRVRAPYTIYHVLAGNLAVSGQHSLLCGLVFGAHNHVKLPSHGGEGIREFVNALPEPLQELVELHPVFDSALLQKCDAVIAFGRDETVAEICAWTRWDQRFLGYGLQVSLLWLGALKKFSPKLVQAIAHDICIYDQMGCLSPQAIYLAPGANVERFCAMLAEAMTREIAALPPVTRLPVDSGLIAETLDTARALGQRVWSVGDSATAGAVIHDPQSAFRFSCLHRVIRVQEVALAQLPEALELVRGKISTIGLAEKLTPALEKIFLPLGVKRFCPAGRMQHPPLWWLHDGRPSLADLVLYVSQD